MGIYKEVINATGSAVKTINGNLTVSGTLTTNSNLTVSGTALISGTVTTNDRFKDATGFVMPVGTILPYGGSGAPDGFLLCDGTAVSRTTYSALYSVTANRWGYGNNSTTFNLPDLRAKFLRGRTTSSGTGAYQDPDLSVRSAINTGGSTGSGVGSYQADEFESHGHNTSGADDLNTRGQWAWGGDNAGGSTVVTASSGGDETRPMNAFVEYIIKY